MTRRPYKPKLQFNRLVADNFRQMADLLRQQGANVFRIKAYLRGATILDELDNDVRDILHRSGIQGLIEIPGIGRGMASAIEELAHQGTWSQLERLRGTVEPELLFQTIPGIGPLTAQRLHDTLHIDTLEGLEAAAHNGTLASVPGIGPRRAAAIRTGLTALLQRSLPRYSPAAEPSVAMLLDVDREYRQRAAAGELRTIAPRRFNPTGRTWLPILHTKRAQWHFTALFSNTALAHQLHRTQDWVVIYSYDDDHMEGQHTVVTETRGNLKGRRVVRGRERQCGDYYRCSRREEEESSAYTNSSR